MKKGFLSEFFAGVAAKRLRPVEIDSASSNQHEFNGTRALIDLLGTERLSDCPTRFFRLGDDNEKFSEDSYVTWYDSRENHPTRSEFRLYFRGNPVMEQAQAGDLLVVAMRPEGTLTIIVAVGGSTIENQLLWLLNVPDQVSSGFQYRDFMNGGDKRVEFAARFILDELGIEVEDSETDVLDAHLKKFEGEFPTTAVFSELARNTLPSINPLDDPDAALLAWIQQEEKLFRRLERQIVADRLATGFWNDSEADVDAFIQFSLSVQNRRKSRAGYALENHLEKIFRLFGLQFEREGITENKSKPDFLFPGSNEYHNLEFPAEGLSMLGAKSTCKDRWRQVLSEASRIEKKHLLTLEPSISQNQTNEMQASDMQLVVPAGLQETYRQNQQRWLMRLSEFIALVQNKQSKLKA